MKSTVAAAILCFMMPNIMSGVRAQNFGSLPATGNGQSVATATFQLPRSTEVSIDGYSRAYIWGEGGYVTSEVYINGRRCVSNERRAIAEYTGTQEVRSSCVFVAEANQVYVVENRSRNEKGEPTEARVFAKELSTQAGLAGLADALGRVSVVMTVATRRQVQFVVQSDIVGLKDDDGKTAAYTHEISLELDGKPYCGPNKKSQQDSLTLVCTAVFEPGKSYQIDGKQANSVANNRNLRLLVRFGSFRESPE